jgi:hypothetical protein
VCALPSLVAVPPLPVFRLGLSAGICQREPLLGSDASRCPVAKALSAWSEAGPRLGQASLSGPIPCPFVVVAG